MTKRRRRAQNPSGTGARVGGSLRELLALVCMAIAVDASAAAPDRAAPAGVQRTLPTAGETPTGPSVSPAPDASSAEGSYRGERLSLNFQEVEVRGVLQLIADFIGANLITSDSVTGTMTLRLEDVPWDQALDLILRTEGLAKREYGNVLLIGPADELASQERTELENLRELSELAPLTTEYVRVRYANAAQMVALLGSGAGSVLSERGAAMVDERTNTVVLTDTAERLSGFRAALAKLDIPVRQVLIKGRIVNVNRDYSERLGIRWGGLGREVLEDGRELQYGGMGATADATAEGGKRGNWVVNFAEASSAATRVQMGLAAVDYHLDLELSALASEGHAEIIARPQVVTTDKQQATIESGVEIPYQEASSSGATSTSFKQAVLQLEVVPHVTPNERIIMDLVVKQDTVGTLYNGVPSINTTKIITQVFIDNGQTVVLGGITRTDRNASIAKTPFFGDLPFLGSLFRRSSERDDEHELLICITPRGVDYPPAVPPSSDLGDAVENGAGS
ncbi:MAG: type IV pilus secretin PilQ [Gammaproteobacteria bacterium]|nr:type IV pilus secretin PilQ [Gammaproteobacteria bacterium]